MSASPQKPSASFWGTVVIAALLTYPLSFGPACWLDERTGVGANAISIVYRPIIWLATKNAWVEEVVLHYAGLGTTGGRGPIIINNKLCWYLADFTELIHLIQSSVSVSNEWIEGPIDDPGAVADDRP
jgi:hypothetical protein